MSGDATEALCVCSTCSLVDSQARGTGPNEVVPFNLGVQTSSAELSLLSVNIEVSL